VSLALIPELADSAARASRGTSTPTAQRTAQRAIPRQLATMVHLLKEKQLFYYRMLSIAEKVIVAMI
jgi:hypothetical protein